MQKKYALSSKNVPVINQNNNFKKQFSSMLVG